ncbi:hypothetical protein SteCoe_5316 [Stentor coeruleus]|uniref:Uncharacterized protein n=1 Tax=Stentor coeruleus TaxID=5963 RepID=A0A1R2CSJ9_9CILI|nr:hypothetical protein SteCoe_5316 [Stentor coeruleus]
MSARKTRGELSPAKKSGDSENVLKAEVEIEKKSPAAMRKPRSRSRTPRKTPAKDDKSLKYRARENNTGKNAKVKSPVKGSHKSPIKNSKTTEVASKNKSPIKRTPPKRSKTDK